MPSPAVTDIAVSALSKHFGPIRALDEVDLTVPSAALFGLIGPDGAGKTTLLRILSTVLQPTSGSAMLFQHSVTGPRKRITPRIGYMPQQFSLYPDLTVAENLDLFATIRSVPKALRKSRAETLLKKMRLDAFATRRAGLLSGGMKQKLMLASVLLHDPDLLLLDEPTTGVDPVSRHEFWELLAELHGLGKTILVATPDMDEAERCDEVAFLSSGRITMTGTPAEVSGSIPGQVYQVLADNPPTVQRALDALDEVVTTQLTGGEAIRVLALELTAVELADALLASGVEFTSIEPVPTDLETAFIYLATMDQVAA
jgi:ABC-2 type transport system ATP-binding protein